MPDKFDPQLRDVDSKPGPRPAASYALLYPRLVEAVRPLGYALAMHGSMNRDLDMVAIPWTDQAVEPEKVAEAIREAVDGFTGWDTEPGKRQPHGRRCWLIWFQGVKYPFGGGACIDLSVMPRVHSELATDHEQPVACEPACDTCGSEIVSYPNSGCPSCGAPNCCPKCSCSAEQPVAADGEK